MEISMRTLHNRLHEYRLRRRNTESQDGEIVQAIQQELDGHGCMERLSSYVAFPSFGLQNTDTKKKGRNNFMPCRS